MQCDAITQSRRSVGDYLKWVGDNRCQRTAAYVETGTDGRTRYYCKQHAGEPATVMSKSSHRPRSTCTPIHTTRKT